MDEFKLRINGLPVGVLAAVAVTTVLFIALPLLTQFQRQFTSKEKKQGVLISSRKPAPPPAEDRDEPKKQEMKKKETQKQKKQTRRAQPKIAAPRVSLGMGGSGVGSIAISMNQNFAISDSLFMSAFNLNEVDQPPRPLRVFPPQYPYLAKRDNIEGKVILRFVVDTDGVAKEAEVVSADPEGFFEEAALKAIERYKFKPAVKGGKDVTCIVKLPISFTLN